MAWRRARSLVVLEQEIQEVAPGTTVWDIGDEDHQRRASDHNPNPAGVVCAIDVLGNAGLDLAHLAETVRTSGHPAGKYVIYRDRIASASRGWRWRSYGGAFHSHVHVSVGRGPDGRSTGPYDDTSPWGLLEGDDMPTVDELWNTDGVVRAPGPPDANRDNPYWTPANILRSARTWAHRAALDTAELRVQVAELTGRDVRAELDRHRAELLAALGEELGPALLAELREQLGDVADERLVAAAAAGTRRALGSLDEPTGQEPA